jgi:predicted heme/steroid binding protein/uncharacterized membrane protein
MKYLVLLILCLALYVFHPAPCGATEIYAAQTGKSCSVCHVSASGGGELTAAGKEFAANIAQKAPGQSALAKKLLRFAAGYLHLFTAILWFGTILYVHLVLKPAYAAGGLPRGEVRVGIVSMAVMGVTGVVLTKLRFGSPAMLLQSHFGYLLLAKIVLYLVMVVSALIAVLVIGPKLKAKKDGNGNGNGALPPRGDLTPEQLASFDGKDGRPAFFAYQGQIYDATASRLWKQGVHMGRHNAGLDLTDSLPLAPHDAEKLAGLPVVGALLAQGAVPRPLHERVFYFMAYMNLSIVFLIVLIISLWRFWA